MAVITCPWCGTNYLAYQPNCSRCGGPLPIIQANDGEEAPALEPPSTPRPIADAYAWRLLTSDGWAITALVLTILGLVFTLVGGGLTLGIITAFVGIPFLALGMTELIAGLLIIWWRYQKAREIVQLIRWGEVANGEVQDVSENFKVTVNNRHPWHIRYRFNPGAGEVNGSVSTLNLPGEQLKPGKAVYVLYALNKPQLSTIYPHP